MKWMLTKDSPELAEALRAEGQEVLSEPRLWAETYITDHFEHPREYPLEQFARELRPDVAVLADPLRILPVHNGMVEFGYFRGHGKRLRLIGVSMVMYAPNDPETWSMYQRGMVRSCVCQPNDTIVYVTPSEEVKASVATKMRSVLWKPGLDAKRLVAAVAHGRGGKTYSPKRGDEW